MLTGITTSKQHDQAEEDKEMLNKGSTAICLTKLQGVAWCQLLATSDVGHHAYY